MKARQLTFEVFLFVGIAFSAASAQEQGIVIAPGTPSAGAASSADAERFNLDSVLTDAETPAPTPATKVTPDGAETAVSSATAPISGKEGLLLLESDMAEATYKLNSNQENRDTAVTALERLVAFYCMPQLHKTLQHTGPDANPKCDVYLEKTVFLDPTNPVVSCAKNGIDSNDCRDLFSEEKVATFSSVPSSGKGSAAAAELQAVLNDSKGENDFHEMKSKIRELTFAFEESKSEQDRMRIIDSYDDYLNRACSISRIKLVPVDPSLEKNKRKRTTKGRDEVLESALRQLSARSNRKKQERKNEPVVEDIIDRKSAASATPKPLPAMGRVRLITDQCDRAVRAALEFERSHPLAICHYLGFFSPQCIDALRTFRANRAQAPAMPGKTQPAGQTPLAQPPPSRVRDSLQSF